MSSTWRETDPCLAVCGGKPREWYYHRVSDDFGDCKRRATRSLKGLDYISESLSLIYFIDDISDGEFEESLIRLGLKGKDKLHIEQKSPTWNAGDHETNLAGLEYLSESLALIENIDDISNTEFEEFLLRLGLKSEGQLKCENQPLTYDRVNDETNVKASDGYVSPFYPLTIYIFAC